jgi:hypothetical protein
VNLPGHKLDHLSVSVSSRVGSMGSICILCLYALMAWTDFPSCASALVIHHFLSLINIFPQCF